MKNQYKKELQVAKRAANLAGDILIKKFGKKHKISFKVKHEIVTNVDIEANKIIVATIKKAFPDHDILSEEKKYKNHKNGHLWIIDPLDGTNNFAHGLTFFGTCIALIDTKNNDILLGIVNIPYSKEMYWAVKGEGAYKNKEKIKVGNQSSIKSSYIFKCHGYDKKENELDHKIMVKVDRALGSTRRIGAAGMELGLTAEGLVDGGYIIGTKPWDSAAGALIVREAGGLVTDFKGTDWKITDNNILFSNGKIHKKLLDIINK